MGVAGVLVFIEQHHPVAGAQLLADLRDRRGQPGRGRHLGAEVHHFVRPHPAVQGVDQGDQFGTLGLSGQHAQQPLTGPAVTLVAARRQGVHQLFEPDMGVAELACVDEVFGELIRQPQHGRGDRGRVFIGVQLARIAVDDVEGQLPQLGLAEQPGVRLDGLSCARGQQAVFPQ